MARKLAHPQSIVDSKIVESFRATELQELCDSIFSSRRAPNQLATVTVVADASLPRSSMSSRTLMPFTRHSRLQ